MNPRRIYTTNQGVQKLILILLSTVFASVSCATLRSRRQLKAGDSVLPWPEGTYGLPMAAPSTCPSSKGFTWTTGSRYHNSAGTSKRSEVFHLASSVNFNGVEQRFCIKDVDADDTSRPSWPKGRYCIYKKGASCPYGLSEGWVLWDDKNDNNNNTQNGSLPSGTFNQDTKIFFCCQTVGNIFETIYLPVEKPFYLIAFKSVFSPGKASCQDVHGAVASVEYIKFGAEQNSASRVSGQFPYGADSKPQYIYYCYYSDCNWHLSELSGSFNTPNYPAGYNGNLDCTWAIAIPAGKITVLNFDVFELEASSGCARLGCPCDYIEIIEYFSDGLPALMGRYCMGVNNTPPVIRSMAVNLTVLFHSDTSRSGKGFKASYYVTEVSTTTSPVGVLTPNTTTESSTTEVSTTESSTTGVPMVSSSTTLKPSKTASNETGRDGQLEPIPIAVGFAVAAYLVIVIVFVLVVLCLDVAKGPSRETVAFKSVADRDDIVSQSSSGERNEDNVKLTFVHSYIDGRVRPSPSLSCRGENKEDLEPLHHVRDEEC